MIPEPIARFEIGQKLAGLRAEANLTLADLSDATNISQDLLQQYEESTKIPPLESLVAIADAFSVEVEFFLQTPPSEHQAEVVRTSDRWEVKPITPAAKILNFRYQALSYRLTERLMSPYLVEIPPSKSVEVEPSAHPGEEFLFVLAGELEAHIGGKTHRLTPGDSLYFSSNTEHSLRAVGAQSTRFLACFSNVRRPYESSPLTRAFHSPE